MSVAPANFTHPLEEAQAIPERRRRSHGPRNSPPSLPRFRQASLLQSLRSSGSSSQSLAERGPVRSPVRDGQALTPMTEEQTGDSDQSENSMGVGAGCSPIRRRKRRDPIWRHPQGPGKTANVRQRSRLGARAEPPPSLPGASGGLRGRGKQRAEPISRRWEGWRPWGGRTTVGSALRLRRTVGACRPPPPPEAA